MGPRVSVLCAIVGQPLGRVVKLVLGVEDFPYEDDPGGISTGDVAEWLEKKYGIMQAFANVHASDIEKWLCQSLAETIEQQNEGRTIGKPDWGTAENEIASDYRTFLRSQEVERIGLEGVPTWAAWSGKSNRHGERKRKAKKGRAGQTVTARRPSFVDTGQYVASVRVSVKD